MHMTSPRSTYCGAMLLSALLAGAGCTHVKQPQTTATSAPTNATPATHTLARAAAKAKPQFDAVFEALEMAPVKLEPKVWTDLTVLEAAPHGTRVKKGDMLVKLDIEKLKEQLDELERDQPASKLTLELSVAELQNLEQTTPLKLDAARRAQRNATEDLNYFAKTGRGAKEKSADFNIKNAEQRLEGAREELKQLQKMYKADDLVEDTEEIILKRQKFAVESGEYGLEVAKQGADWSLKHTIPREAELFTAGKRDQELALQLAQETLPRTLAKKRLDLEKLKRDQKKAEKRFADLKRDLELLSEVRAPADGLVYYGACEAGKWTTGATVAKKLVPTGKLLPNEVFITVVNPDKMILRAIVPEADLGQFTPGLEGKATPISAPELKVTVKLDDLGTIPLPAGGFEARLSVQPRAGARIMPGMNCKVVLTAPQAADRLRAPKEAVFSNGSERHVFVLKSDGTSEKRVVKTGLQDDKTVEIIEGLSEGEKILLHRPK